MSASDGDKIQVHGHCACGHARYTVTLTLPDVPERTLRAVCHCTACARINGAPYIWTSHWKGSAVRWAGASTSAPPAAPAGSPPDEVTPGFLAAFLGDRLDTWQSKPGSKWKLRCRACGSPMGSWSRVKGGFSLWPTTLERAGREGPLIGLEHFAPTMHMFYSFRTTDVEDDLPKWSEAPGSQRLTNAGQPLVD